MVPQAGVTRDRLVAGALAPPEGLQVRRSQPTVKNFIAAILKALKKFGRR
jgi:hypothetical protein